MIAFLSLFAHVLISPFKTQARLEAEIVILRHQLNVLRRQAPNRRLPALGLMVAADANFLFDHGASDIENIIGARTCSTRPCIQPDDRLTAPPR
jgi:hypothetical protein